MPNSIEEIARGLTEITVVVRRVGDYEPTETLVRAFDTGEGAAAFIEKADAEWQAAVAAVPDTLDSPEGGAPDDEWAKWEKARERAWKRFRKMLTCDPEAAPDSAWSSPDEPDYYLVTVPFTALRTHLQSRQP